jgi:hypothetical protein
MNCRLLRDLDIERNLFCSLTVAETDEGKLATQRRLGRSSTAVGASSGGAPALESALTTAEWIGQPPSGLGAASFELAWRRWLGLVTGAAMGKSVHGGAWVLLFVGQRVQHGRSIVPEIPSNRIEDS